MKILRITLLPEGQADCLIWDLDKRWSFMVNSAYKLIKKDLQNQVWESSNVSRLDALWKAIWNMRVSKNIQVMAWRACNDVLPTKKELFRRHITLDSLCDICKSTEEDSAHALVCCPTIWSYWSNFFPPTTKITQSMSFMEMTLAINNKVEDRDLEIFFMLAWIFWYKRNKWTHEQLSCEPWDSIEYALTLYKQWKETWPSKVKS